MIVRMRKGATTARGCSVHTNRKDSYIDLHTHKSINTQTSRNLVANILQDLLHTHTHIYTHIHPLSKKEKEKKKKTAAHIQIPTLSVPWCP